jgi:hypothetical protein
MAQAKPRTGNIFWPPFSAILPPSVSAELKSFEGDKSIAHAHSKNFELYLIHPVLVGLAKAQQIKAAQKPNSFSAHPTQ